MRKGINFRFFHTLFGAAESLPKASPQIPGTGRSGFHHYHQAADGERPLSHCREGDQILIRRISGGGPIHRRLLEMGLTPGTPIRIIKYAPLKDPLECEVKGYHVALRVAEAQMILVAPTSP